MIEVEIPIINLNTGEPAGTDRVFLTSRQYRAIFGKRNADQSREDWLRFWEPEDESAVI